MHRDEVFVLLVGSLAANGALVVELGKMSYGMMSLIFTAVLIALFVVNSVLSARRGIPD